MQDLEAVASQLGKIATAFKDGGLYFLIGIGLFLAYLVLMAVVKRQKTPSVNVEIGKGGNGNGAPKVCPLHSGLEAEIKAIQKSTDQARDENREDHRQMFDAIGALKQA